MALVLSSSKSSILEPVKKNRWVMQFKSIPGASGQEEGLAFVAHTCTPPAITFNQSTHKRMNETFYGAGTPTWNEFPMSFYDFINNTGTSLSAAQILYQWQSMIYDPLTGQMGFKKQYSTSGTLAQLDPKGAVIRAWNLFYVWPASITYGDGLSSDADEIADISVTFRYDLAIKNVDVNTVPA